jgi:MFS family permease
LFASLQHIGTLIAPMFGVMGDRIGHRNVLCAMRTLYAILATTTMIFAFMGVLTPTYVLSAAAVMGLVRPSDVGMRAALVGETMPAGQLIGAMSIQRTTMDSARIAGALSGAGLVAALGIGPAYAGVASLYVISILLTLQAGGARRRVGHGAEPIGVAARASPWLDLKAGLAYVWHTPFLRAVMLLAFVLNLTAFPLTNSLLPYVAKEIYGTDQTGLGYMVAAVALGALAGSIVLSRHGGLIRPARMMLTFTAAWFAALLVFAHTERHIDGILVLLLTGCAQSMSQVPMAALLLRTSNEQFRGRIMGIRMLAIYGNVPGLLLSAPLIAHIGYPTTATVYCAFGLLVMLIIALRWRAHLWRLDAPANMR